jgi:uncharacterized protein involved in exopolysaccharide biosynthesis
VETAKIALEQHTPLLQDIDKPLFPLGKEIPNAFSALMMGLFLGGFIGVLLVLGRKAYIDFIVNKNNPFLSKDQNSDNFPQP